MLRQLEMLGVYPLNESVALIRCRGVLCSLQLRTRNGISLSITGYAHKADHIQDRIKMVDGQ